MPDAVMYQYLLDENRALRARLVRMQDMYSNNLTASPGERTGTETIEMDILVAEHFTVDALVRVEPAAFRADALDLYFSAALPSGRVFMGGHMVDKHLTVGEGWPYLDHLHRSAMRKIFDAVQDEEAQRHGA